MSDKWQQIGLKLDPELAKVLRAMKQGHDESLAEVVIRLLKKLVRESPAGARGAPAGRQGQRGASGRGAFGAGRRGKQAPAAGAPRGPAGASVPPRAPRQRRGKAGSIAAPRQRTAPRPELEASGETRRRDFSAPPRAAAARPRAFRGSDELGAADGPKRPRAAKRRRSSRG